MNRDLLICIFSAFAFFTFSVISAAQEPDTPPPVDDATSLDVTTVESSTPVRSIVIRQETAQQLYTPSVVTKTLLSDEQAERTLLPAVDTISGAEIRTFQRYDIGDILSQTAGVNLVEAGQTGAQTSLFIRGMESNHAVVLLNGRRLPPGLAGIYQLEYLDVSTLESVQITKGASSSLYGSDALAGVIDMRSTDARYLEADTLSSYLEGGSFATIRTGHKLTIKDGPVAVAIDTSALETANDRASSDFENALLRGNVAVELGKRSYFDILGYIQDSFIQVPGSSLSPFFPEQQINKNLSTLFSPRFSIFRGDWDFSTFYSHTANELEARKDTFFNDNLLEQTGHEAEAVINFRPNEETAYTLGAGYYGYEFERTPIVPGPFNLPSEFGFSYTSVFAQAGINLPADFNILTSGRYDEHDSFTSKGTYTAQITRDFEPTGTTLFAKSSTGYKAPSGQDFIFLDPDIDPTSIRPEENMTWEAGARQSVFNKRGSVALTYFSAGVENLIDVDPFTFVDPAIVDTRTRGLELELVYSPVENLRFYAGGTWLDAIITDGQYLGGFGGSPGDRLTRRPEYSLAGGGVMSGDHWKFGAEIRGAYERIDAPNFYLAPYTVARLFGSVEISDEVELYGRIENLFDLAYENTRGFEAAGFGAFAGVRLLFGR